MLFPPPRRELAEAEVAAHLQEAILRAPTGLPRPADTYLAGLSADYLAARLREAGVICAVDEPPHPDPRLAE